MQKSRRESTVQQVAAPTIKPKTEKQAALLKALQFKRQIVVVGCAGTGKTFCVATKAAQLLKQGKVKRIIITRPNVPAGPTLGLLPGTLAEKFGAWTAPFTIPMQDFLGKVDFDNYVSSGAIESIPFELMRGRSFENAFVVCDEAQNTNVEQMKMLVTRIGEGTTIVINGDCRQKDIKVESGLAMLINLVKHYQELMHYSEIIEFTIDDVVRSDICGDWLKVFDNEGI